MRYCLKSLLLSMLCIFALSGCSKEPKTNPTEPVNMAGALFILDEGKITADKEYIEEVLTVFRPAQIESIVHDRLAESNFLSGKNDFVGEHRYQLLSGEHGLKEAELPEYVYLWIADLNILKKIYKFQDTLCDFNPSISMQMECLDEAAGVIYEGSFALEEDAAFTYAAYEEYQKQYETFEEIVNADVPLLAKDESVDITVFVMKGFAWELKAGSVKAYAALQSKNGSCTVYELHLSYDEDGQAHLESRDIGSNLTDFPEADTKLLYQYSIP